MKEKAKEILFNSTKRPTSKEALEINDEDVFKIAKEIDYSLNLRTLNKIYHLHSMLMPIAENMITRLLKQTEKEEPTYYPFARDAELFYDALCGIAQAGEKNLEQRIHLLKTSNGMKSTYKADSEYFSSIGINNNDLSKNTAIFIDSGFAGSLFNYVVKEAKIDLSAQNRIKGFLVCKAGGLYTEMSFINKNSKKLLKQIINRMKDSPYLEILPNNLHQALCHFMQLTPKATGRYVQTYKKINGEWDVMPEKNRLFSKCDVTSKNKKYLHSNESCLLLPNGWKQRNSIEQKCGWVNDDVVDPFASLLLQKRTLEYFTDSNVHDRIYDSIK